MCKQLNEFSCAHERLTVVGDTPVFKLQSSWYQIICVVPFNSRHQLIVQARHGLSTRLNVAW